MTYVVFATMGQSCLLVRLSWHPALQACCQCSSSQKADELCTKVHASDVSGCKACCDMQNTIFAHDNVGHKERCFWSLKLLYHEVLSSKACPGITTPA